MDVEEIDIIGGGLVGGLLGIKLREKHGWRVRIWERYEDVRKIPALGRSINLVLTSRGLRALSDLSPTLLTHILSLATPVYGRILHPMNGSSSLTFQPYGKDSSECNWSISRYALNCALITYGLQIGVTYMFGHQLVSCQLPSSSSSAPCDLFFRTSAAASSSIVRIGGDLVDSSSSSSSSSNANSSQAILFPPPHLDPALKKVSMKRLIATDGGGSVVRYALRDSKLLTFTEEFVEMGYKELLFPASSASSMDQRGLHIWPRRFHFLMALVNRDGSWTGTIYIPKTGAVDSFEHLQTPATVSAFFNKFYSDAIPLLGGIDSICSQFLKNPVGSLGIVRTSHYNFSDKVLLVGDAAHAIVPFFGQGTNCGFEDVKILSELISSQTHPTGGSLNFADIFQNFHRLRKPNCDAIADLSLANMIEMRDRVADPRFLLAKEIEHKLENLIPLRFRSGYAMATYGGLGNVTYENALILGKLQSEILTELVSTMRSIDDLDLERAFHLIDTKLLPLQKSLGVDLSTVSPHLSSPSISKL